MQATQQHDLTPGAASRVLREAKIREGETVVDIGAGKGALTRLALDAGAKVHALELDPRRVEALRTTFAAEIADGRLRLWPGDAMQWTADLPPGWRILANPPFNITAALVQRWIVGDVEGRIQLPDAFDLVLQREAAQKMTPRQGEQTRSSVLVALAGRASVRCPLPRDATSPPSRVDLCVWSFRREPDQITRQELIAADKLLHKAFAGSHTVIDSVRGLATGIQVRRQAVERGWRPIGHPRHLQPADWLSFAKLLMTCHKL